MFGVKIFLFHGIKVPQLYLNVDPEDSLHSTNHRASLISQTGSLLYSSQDMCLLLEFQQIDWTSLSFTKTTDMWGLEMQALSHQRHFYSRYMMQKQ